MYLECERNRHILLFCENVCTLNLLYAWLLQAFSVNSLEIREYDICKATPCFDGTLTSLLLIVDTLLYNFVVLTDLLTSAQ